MLLPAAIFHSNMFPVLKLIHCLILVSSLGKVLASPKRLKLCINEALPSSAKPGEGNQEEIDGFGSHLMSLAIKNIISATEASSLINKGRRAGLKIKGPFQPAEGNHRKRKIFGFEEKNDKKEPGDGTSSRALTRWLARQNNWTALYWADIPFWNPSTKKRIVFSHPFLLPHEWLDMYLLQAGAFQEGQPEEGSFFHKELKKGCRAWGQPGEGMFPLGLHGDGVPYQGRMNQSTLDYVTINFPGSKLLSHKRFLVTCVDSKWSLGHETWQAIWQVIAWSFQQLGEGRAACRRHDGKSLEKARLKMAGKSLQKACLVQMRGDWDWNVKVFGAPTFNTKLGMCWMCNCKPGDWHAMSQEDRRRYCLGKADWLANLAAREKPAMQLFNLKGVSNQTMFPDWMHAVDEGIAASVVGQCLKEFESHCAGSNKDERLNALWGFIKDLYQKNNTDHDKRLWKLTSKDFVKSSTVPPELDAKAAQVKGLCPLLHHLAQRLLPGEGTPHQRAVKKLAKLCSSMYTSLEKADLAQLVRHGRLLKQQWMALETEAQAQDDFVNFHSKPKWHFFDHLLDQVQEGLHPKSTWCYQDETFGHLLQGFGQRRGGKRNPSSHANKVLLAWMAEEEFPSFFKASA